MSEGLKSIATSKQWSQKQLEVLNYPDVAHLFLCGAARGGKTFCSILRFVFKLLDVRKHHDDCAIITKTSSTFMRNFYKPLQELLPNSMYSLNFYKKTINICGVTCWIIPANDSKFDDKIKGGTFSALYIDELTTLSQQRYWLATTRMAKRYSMIVSTSNPSTSLHFVKKEILDVEKDNPRFKYFHFVLDDNPSLTEEDKEQFKRKFRGVMYDRYILGKWVQDTGRVYDFVPNEYVMSEEPDITPERYFIGIDVGISKPFCAILFAEHSDTSPRVWACSEIYYSPMAMNQAQKTSTEYCTLIDKHWGHLQCKIDCVYVTAEHQLIRDILSTYNYNVETAKDNLLQGIEVVSDMMYSGEYKIYKKCTRLIEEKESYCWKEKMNYRSTARDQEKVLRVDDDAMDAERFALYTRYRNKETLDEENPPFRHGLIHNAVMQDMEEKYYYDTDTTRGYVRGFYDLT